MKKLQFTTKLKQAFTWLFLIFTVLFFVLLFVFKDSLNDYASKAVKAQAGSEIQNSVPVFVDSAYNYTKNGLSYEITFLEFGSKGCSACKRMESVMDEIRTKYPNLVNVVFINIMLPESQRLMKYYGIAAIPTQVLLNKEGKEFFRHTGYYSANNLIIAFRF
jgi:thioredoxin 1